jgi:ribosomal protein L24
MKYLTGEDVEIGDIVLIERGRTVGVVSSIIETLQDMQAWGVVVQGVMIEAKPFGLVLWNHEDTSSPLVFKKRKD